LPSQHPSTSLSLSLSENKTGPPSLTNTPSSSPPPKTYEDPKLLRLSNFSEALAYFY